MSRLLLNGRFLTRPMTGVDRTALSLVRHMESPALDVAVPAGAPGDEEIRYILGLPKSSEILRSPRSGYFWEQVELARLRPRQTLLSLCNMGPVMRRNQLVLIHDAQVFDAPQSYSLAFRSAYNLLLPILASRARVVATVSDYSRGRLRAHGIGNGRRIEVIPNAASHILETEAEHGALRKFDLEPGSFLLALGSLARHKNLDMLVSACEARRDRSIPLIIAGGGNEKVFRDALGSFGPNVRCLGRVSDSELRALYENTALFLFPSLTEGFGLPALEAMILGAPILASTGGAIPEVCGEAAHYCHPRDEAGWTQEIERLLGDPAERLANVQDGKARARRFNWTSSARHLRALATISEAPHSARSDFSATREATESGNA